MRIHLLVLALPLLGVRCIPTGDLGPADDSGTPADDSGDPSPDDSGMGPCESGLCEATVIAAEVSCRQSHEPEGGLVATSPAPGTVEVVHYAVREGCCPSLNVTALQDLRHDTIEATYDLYDDLCDCICELNVRYTLADLQPGSFTLQAEGESADVTVE